MKHYSESSEGGGPTCIWSDHIRVRSRAGFVLVGGEEEAVSLLKVVGGLHQLDVVEVLLIADHDSSDLGRLEWAE